MSEFKKLPIPNTYYWIIRPRTGAGWDTELLVTLRRRWPSEDVAWFGAEATDESVTYAMERCIEVLEPPPKKAEPPEHLKRYLT